MSLLTRKILLMKRKLNRLLRDEYRKSVISNLKSQLDNVKIVDEEAVEEELEKEEKTDK